MRTPAACSPTRRYPKTNPYSRSGYGSFRIAYRLSVRRFVLSLPGSWRAETFTFNADTVKPMVTEGTYTWELKKICHFLNPSRPARTSARWRVAGSELYSAEQFPQRGPVVH